jgi:hypothetical protein
MSCKVIIHRIYGATLSKSITTRLQFNQNNSFSTTIQLHYNYTHDVMLKSLIIIHLLKSNTWHYENFGH